MPIPGRSLHLISAHCSLASCNGPGLGANNSGEKKFRHALSLVRTYRKKRSLQYSVQVSNIDSHHCPVATVWRRSTLLLLLGYLSISFSDKLRCLVILFRVSSLALHNSFEDFNSNSPFALGIEYFYMYNPRTATATTTSTATATAQPESRTVSSHNQQQQKQTMS